MAIKKATAYHQINTLTDYVQFIEDTCLNECNLFRGQSEDWPLRPKIARIIPKTGQSVLQAEKNMVADFKRLARPFLKTVPSNEWEWLALAQHHGMATRLLDWTSNPLAALWFTVQKPPTAGYGVVWAFDAPEDDIIKSENVNIDTPYTGTKTRVFQPEITTVRIQSQNGWFTVHKFVQTKNKFVSFETNAAYIKYLIKIIIPASNYYKLRFQLDRMGINRLTLFPDLEGAANHSEWINSFLTDEIESINSNPKV